MERPSEEKLNQESILHKSLSVLTFDAIRRSSKGSVGEGRNSRRASRQYAPLPTSEADAANFSSEPQGEEDLWHDFVHRWKRGDFTIIPEGNVLLDLWDLLVMLALFLTAIVLPVDVALYIEEPGIFHAIMKAADITFVVDIVLTFFIAYHVTTATNVDMFERAPLKIARRYLALPFSDHGKAGWFWCDTLTMVPWDEFGEFKDLGLVRLLRLSRMFRLVRFIKLFAKWQMQFGYTISLLQAAYTIGATLVTCHWVACAWSHLAMVAEDRNRTWLNRWLQRHNMDTSADEVTPAEVYNLALYWCISTLTSVGYGDVLPQNQLEVGLLSATMLVLGTLWAWVLAHMVSMLQNSDVFAAESHQLMDDLNFLMIHRGLDHGLRQRCRKHLYESFHVHRQRHQQRTVRWLSAGLQGEIAVESGVDKASSCIWYLRNLENPVLIAIAQRFVGDIFSPNEYIHLRYSVAVIRKGTCIKRKRLLSRDDVIGEDMILATDHLMDYMAPKSLTFVEVMTLSRSDLVSVCENQPSFDRRMRKAQIRLAVWRAIVLEADARRRGKASFLAQYLDPSESANLVAGRHLGFSQCIARGDYNRGGVPFQESISGLAEQLSAMRRRQEDANAACIKELATLSSRMEEHLGRGPMPPRRPSVRLPFCGGMR